jgi:hypothetical protein
VIGVLAKEQEREVVREFFELFKTPWEFVQPNGRYDVVISTVGVDPGCRAKLLLIYGSEPLLPRESSLIKARRKGASLSYKGNRIPIYGHCLAFESRAMELPMREASGSVAFRTHSLQSILVRVGIDLFEEVRFLLTTGQPASNAQVATLDWHIALLRDFIFSAGLSVVEIPPVPAGHTFAVCLTHDVDHPVLRNHKLDHTSLGFLYRAIVGSVLNGCRGRMPVRDLLRNWLAAVRFPFVQLGLAHDFWSSFDRYLEFESGLGSTFYVLPQGGVVGRRVPVRHPERRAARYELADIRPQLNRIRSSGAEIGLHGIDAWMDSTEGRDEQSRIAALTERTEMGVRMHWLCFDEDSPAVLDQAGFSYDSTFGYNQTVGYRAGTLQAFRQPGVTKLMELPMHIMDTALFQPNHLHLSTREAAKIMRQLFSDAVSLGGVLTLNWHDRSIAPERLWGDFYLQMLEEIKRLDPWFATAMSAVGWFRLRRSAVFDEVRQDGRVVKVKVSVPTADVDGLPGLRLRITQKAGDREMGSSSGEHALRFSEESFNRTVEMSLPSSPSGFELSSTAEREFR